MANFTLTERSDGTVYLKCRCGEITQPCDYKGEVTFAGEGFTLMRQAKREAYDHCWNVHKIPAYAVAFEVTLATEQVPDLVHAGSILKPFLVTTEPQKEETETYEQKVVNDPYHGCRSLRLEMQAIKEREKAATNGK